MTELERKELEKPIKYLHVACVFMTITVLAEIATICMQLQVLLQR